ncbi:Alkaline phosphatase [Enhygromyxa salina]|uniref:Alkaline phosphatase n=1 Tax=Enhygromyxa salina TaxID=215803 RepID=A0A0C2D7H4_9BACT|nr:Alkaline phosphatase [Enhygromyxa salina]
MTACTLPNPAFNEPDTAADDSTSGEPGDGDPGDGDPEDTGDGDSGDGDGDNTDTDTGDGDGDGDPEACVLEEPNGPYAVLELDGIEGMEMNGAPEFNAIRQNCYSITICPAEQGNCGINTSFLGRHPSGGMFAKGGSGVLTPIKVVVHPGPALCGQPALFTTQQSFELNYVVSAVENSVSVRLPCFEGNDTTLFIAEDGSSFWDSKLTDPAALW